MKRRNAARLKPQSAIRIGADGAFCRSQPHDLSVARRTGNAQHHIAAGGFARIGELRHKHGGKHGFQSFGGIVTISPLLDLAYDAAKVKTAGARIEE